MSKPREFTFSEELEDWGVDKYIDRGFDGPWYQVVPKDDADKLAEALEKVNKWRPNEFQDRELYEYGQQALKEYRGEK